MPTIEELKVLRAKAKEDQAAAKKASKKKPPRVKKEKKYADGGEEQWENAIAPPRIVKGKKGRDGNQLLETFQLDTGEWSFSPRVDGDVSIYHASSNRFFGWDDAKGKVTVKNRVECWWYDTNGVQRGWSDSKEAITARQRWEEGRRK